MKPLFDFGISQEDANSEQSILELQDNDRVLCIASGGEVPLNLLCRNNNVQIGAIDISETQLALCRLKLLTALHVGSPDNAAFLGYSEMDTKRRKEIFTTVLQPLLQENDKAFWLQHLTLIGKGVINYGRFELFLKKMRIVAAWLIGKKNIGSLINCSSVQQQEEFFNKKIENRKALRYLFKIAFHPLIYKKRGLDKQGLIHATSNTGENFFKKFKTFCIATPADENYFLQYYLTGKCKPKAIPEFLQAVNRTTLQKNGGNINFKMTSITEALNNSPENYYSKIHLSNVGDWMKEPDFKALMQTVQQKLSEGAKVSCRVLQKDHFANNKFHGIEIDKKLAETLEKKDRFPFYSLFPITICK